MSTTAGPPPATPWPGASALDLDDLLAELRSRASSALRSQERLRDLLSAVVAVTTDLELSEVLGRIVDSAITLVDARYAALGVLSNDGSYLVQFITRGVTEEERALIGDLPRGHGVLGLLIRHPHPQRLDDIGSHPDSYGFPPNHPAMHSFLGTPIRIRDEVYGNLYLAEKRGATAFTAEDEATLVTLAAAAGVAIDNARLFESGRRRQSWGDAVSDITHLLLEREDEQGALALLAARCCEVGGAAYAAVATLEEVEDGLGLVLRATHTTDDPQPAGAALLGHLLDGPVWSALSATRRATIIGETDENSAEQTRAEIARVIGLDRAGSGTPSRGVTPIAVVPLTAGPDELGLLVLGVSVETGSGAAWTERLGEIAEFVKQSALALLAGRAQRDRAAMALMGDRERIARDMHDHVIQRLFATGLSLQSASRLAQNQAIKARIEEAVDDLDVGIREIRSAIFELHRPSTVSAQRELNALASSYSRGIGEPPALTVTGSLDGLTPVQFADVTAVVGEGLSNVARHAAARHAWVRVAVTDVVTIEIEDDGIGADIDAGRSGLVNLAKRAEDSGGTFTLTRRQPSGTILTWQVPRSG
ncbi:MAG: GAF domain-containing protein [Nostocoides sp.]